MRGICFSGFEGSPVPLVLHSPNGIEGFLELREYAGRTEEECDNGQCRRDEAGRRFTDIFKYALNGFRTLLADEALNLSNNLAFSRFLTKYQPGNGDDDQQEGRQEKTV